ncbi:hypothetical protein JW758_02400 [Candidatus Peregrinibacteria bacterium]|nr:hypothetical protein [Candidatus Peregrinibacteria bacterium]
MPKGRTLSLFERKNRLSESYCSIFEAVQNYYIDKLNGDQSEFNDMFDDVSERIQQIQQQFTSRRTSLSPLHVSVSRTKDDFRVSNNPNVRRFWVLFEKDVCALKSIRDCVNMHSESEIAIAKAESTMEDLKNSLKERGIIE